MLIAKYGLLFVALVPVIVIQISIQLDIKLLT